MKKHRKSILRISPAAVIPLLAVVISILLLQIQNVPEDSSESASQTALPASPPSLTISCGDITAIAQPSSYSWQKLNRDGTVTATEVDSAHPLDCRDSLPKMKADGKTAVLIFPQQPSSLTVRCWSDAHWSDPGADSISVTLRGTTVDLRLGGWIYQVAARWAGENQGGTAFYSFYLDAD